MIENGASAPDAAAARPPTSRAVRGPHEAPTAPTSRAPLIGLPGQQQCELVVQPHAPRFVLILYGKVVRRFPPFRRAATATMVRIAMRYPARTAVDRLPDHGDFTELQEACEGFMAELRRRPEPPYLGRVAGRGTVGLHSVPEPPLTTAFGEIRRADEDSTILSNRSATRSRTSTSMRAFEPASTPAS
ncbi:hypothetical protein [Streptomyces sp. NBC_00448]|uniref:hypothetical protein n=1 Tax=Streptomyces sp. NBC_00448 TaxID=2903652 RepID=UPI002E1ED086